MVNNHTLYHGTCRAFVAHALQNNGRFGPNYDHVSFTPEYDHASDFAEDWNTDRGYKRLQEYFGEGVARELAEPVVLEFQKSQFSKLKFRKDGDADEFYVEKGPVQLPIEVQ
jgi:hypothetical protein